MAVINAYAKAQGAPDTKVEQRTERPPMPNYMPDRPQLPPQVHLAAQKPKSAIPLMEDFIASLHEDS